MYNNNINNNTVKPKNNNNKSKHHLHSDRSKAQCMSTSSNQRPVRPDGSA